MTKSKEEISNLFFDGIKTKYIKEFYDKETPAGNFITGFICKKPNHHLGSMVITNIKTKDSVIETEQFVQAMPKIHYYSHRRNMYQDESIRYKCPEKLDGSCLILYAIYSLEGDLIEIIPKTRGLPVADKHIIELYNEIDHSNIEVFFDHMKDQNPTLIFELYGQLNKHSIFYPEVRISISLIAMTLNESFLSYEERQYFSSQYDFKQPVDVFTLIFLNNVWKIRVKSGIYKYYLTNGEPCDHKLEYPTQLDAIQALKTMITKINENYSKVHGSELLEGVVVNSFDYTGEHNLLLKVKSANIEENCRGAKENGVPRRIILKEVQKYFDEYGSRAKEIYKKDPEHSYNYIMNNLSEEYGEDVLSLKKTKNRVKNTFLDTLEAKEPPEGLQEICNNIVEEYPGMDVVDYIRLFAQEYPEKKRQANIAFSIFESICRK